MIAIIADASVGNGLSSGGTTAIIILSSIILLLLSLLIFISRRFAMFVRENESMRKQYFDKLNVPVAIFDEKMNVIVENVQSRTIFGKNPLEMADGSGRNTVHVSLIEHIGSIAVQAAHDKRPHRIVISRQGRELEVFAFPIIDSRGKVKYVLQSATRGDDMGLDDELSAEFHEQRIIYNNVKVPIVLFNNKGNLCKLNREAIEVFGINKTDDPEISRHPLLCGNSDNADDCAVQRTLNTMRPASEDLKINGREFVFTTVPTFDENGILTNIIGSALDVTAVNADKYKVEEAMLAAKAADRAKSIFVATMSHELRTPLNAVIGFSELLQYSEMSEEERNEHLKMINFSGNALLRLINDLLDLSKLEAGQMEIVPVLTNFEEFLGELRAMFRYEAKEKKLEFTIRTENKLPELYIDNVRLRQVLMNITGNAVKFTQDGSVAVLASFSPNRNGTGTLLVRVIDTGIGIPEDYLDKVFDPFIQQNAVRGAHCYGGSGLGLSISKRLVNQMGGRIALESTIGRGSTFSVRLDNIKYVELENNTERNEPVEIKTQTLKKRGAYRSVLLVDDVEMNLRVLSIMLKKLDFKPLTANNGIEALAVLSSHHFDIILTDMWMPDMNGDELANAIRAMPGNKETKIYAITADTEAENNFDISSFTGILNKPVAFESLQKLLFTADEQKESEPSK